MKAKQNELEFVLKYGRLTFKWFSFFFLLGCLQCLFKTKTCMLSIG